jgi:Hydrolase of X-linked nucleoside diphosphate N terminal
VHQRLRLCADEIRAIANEGLHFEGDNPYSARRFRRLLRIATELSALQDVILCHCSSSSSQSSTYGTPPADLINVYA